MKLKVMVIMGFFCLTASSKKSNFKYCNHCTFVIISGSYKKPPLDTCSDVDASNYNFISPTVNDIGFICTPK